MPELEAVQRYYEGMSALAYERAGGGRAGGSGREVRSDREPGDRWSVGLWPSLPSVRC